MSGSAGSGLHARCAKRAGSKRRPEEVPATQVE